MILLFTDVLETWWVGNRLGLREISLYRKRAIIDTHVLPYFGGLEITNIDDVIICSYIADELDHGNRLTKKGLCKNSVKKAVGIVGEVMDYAVKKGLISLNPMLLIKSLKREPTKQFETYVADEVDKLIKVARPKWLGDMINLAYNTGMRRCECFGLQWDDIDFVNKLLVVSRSVTAAKPNDRFVAEPKTRGSKRIIMLDDDTSAMLMRRHATRTSASWVFASKYGDLLSPWYLTKYFRLACQVAGVSGKRFYDLRHTHITQLVEAGIPLPIVQQRAGHSTINMTMHYVHIKADAQNSVVDMLNRIHKTT